MLLLDPQEAVEIGLNEALIINQVRFWLTKSHWNKREMDWVYMTYDSLHAAFPFISKRSLQRIIPDMEKRGLLISEMREVAPGFVCKWYTLQPEEIEKLRQSGEGGTQVGEGGTQVAKGVRKLAVGGTQVGDSIKGTESTTEKEYSSPAPSAPAPRRKIKAAPPPALADLEETIPHAWKDSWTRWSREILPTRNKTETMSEAAMSRILQHLINWQEKNQATDDAMIYGFDQTIKAAVPNEHYVTKCTGNYNPATDKPKFPEPEEEPVFWNLTPEELARL